MRIRLLFLLILTFSIITLPSYSDDGLRTMFLNNQAVICGINIRNFNSKDRNDNGFIEYDEERGNFINAIDRLDEIKSLNINTLHVLPVTPVGKLKAIGTAGSLYAISDFTSINPQLADKDSDLSVKQQAELFINECHKRGIKVIIDLPSCGSYDLYLRRPELFVKDDKNLSIVPTDWTDVRLFQTGNNEKLNSDLFNEHKKFIDMIIDLNADGIRADVATIKPERFWTELIKYAREKNPELLFLAEASDSWRESPSQYAEFTPYNELLRAGFDGYYGSFFNLKDWTKSTQLFDLIKFNKKLFNSYEDKKSAIMSFTTHDEVSPIIIHGEDFSVMICWLEATLPYNPYIIDGFQTGDDYIYELANSRAYKTETDDDTYFVHRGKFDIFNYSRKIKTKHPEVLDNFKKAMEFRKSHIDLITKGNFTQLKVKEPSIFAYSRSYKNETIIVIGNLNKKANYKKISIKIPKINKSYSVESLTSNTQYKISKNNIYTDLKNGEIKVLHIHNFSL